jgi:hypothetical protein
MTWIWVAVGVVVVALVLLAVVTAGTVGHLRPLRRALEDDSTRTAAEALQVRMESLQQTSADVQERVQVTQERIAMLKGVGDGGDGLTLGE